MTKRNPNKVSILVIALMTLFIIAQTSIIYAAPNAASPVGIVNYPLLVQQHPEMAQAQEAMKSATGQAKADFDAKQGSMNDQDKQNLYTKLAQGLQQKHNDLLKPICDKVDAAIKAVADAKGITIVVEKGAAVYGGQDITDEVLKKITGK